MKNLIILSVVWALGAYAQAPPEWKAGTLTRITSGDAYLEPSVGAPGTTYQPSYQIARTDQVYVIVGGGMEYVIAESEHSTAHVVINFPIMYKIEGGRFIFADQEGVPHPARIARQTLIDPSAIPQPITLSVITPAPVAARPAPSLPTIMRWKSADATQHYTLRISADSRSIYVENVDPPRARAGYRLTMDLTFNPARRAWHGDVYLVAPCGKIPTEGTISSITPDRIEGEWKGPPERAKLNLKKCAYDKPLALSRFTLVPE